MRKQNKHYKDGYLCHELTCAASSSANASSICDVVSSPLFSAASLGCRVGASWLRDLGGDGQVADGEGTCLPNSLREARGSKVT